jgi:alkanesulfonate monooxygenase SsuD/methylene tetrahydromethanopterin reductase-like flavin-dependent oxidoreductase (luciferase family)
MDRGHAQLTTSPFAAGSVSFRSYPHGALDAPAVVDELRAQAALAVAHGFDGVMTSEHHGGFAGYLPNPLQLAGFLLDAMPAGWAAPCPLLLTLRPPALVAEEIAWLAARFPGRVGIGVAAGALPADFALMHLDMDDIAARFTRSLEELTLALRSAAESGLARDAAIAWCRDHPIPVLSAAASATAARRAARVGAGLLFDSLATPARVRELIDVYRDAGGDGPCVLVRRAWLGAAPAAEVERQLDVYKSYAPAAATAHWGENEMAAGDGADDVAAALVGAVRDAGADALNVRVHVPGVEPLAARDQIVRLGNEVVPIVKEGLA